MSARRRRSAWLALAALGASVLVGLGADPAGAAPVGSPIGHFDSIRLVGGNLVLTGWAVDRDRSSDDRVDLYQVAPVRAFRGRVVTDVVRTDVSAALHLTGAPGWTFSTPAHPGRQTWCAYALNVGPGANTRLGCLRLTVPAGQAPIGGIDAAFAGGDSTFHLTGWALDRDDLRRPLRVDVYELTPSHRFLTRVLTTVMRPDIDARFRVTGRHGWAATVPLVPGQVAHYCVYAINVGVAGPNPQLGCLDAGSVEAS